MPLDPILGKFVADASLLFVGAGAIVGKAALESTARPTLDLIGHKLREKVGYRLGLAAPPDETAIRRILQDKKKLKLLGDAELLDLARTVVAEISKLDRQAVVDSGLIGSLQVFLSKSGPGVYGSYVGEPRDAPGARSNMECSVKALRESILEKRLQLRKPRFVTVSGALFPCALLYSGWWETDAKSPIGMIKWPTKVQEWLANGFHLWAPSWDFSWDFDNWDRTKDRPFYIAQLGDGDEADSIPVLLPREKALRFYEAVQDRMATPQGWAGLDVKVSGCLGHRRHFEKYLTAREAGLLGGLLDYCIWVSPDHPKHAIEPEPAQTAVYSGYLWRCLAPKRLVEQKKEVLLTDVYFVWEHTNFASTEAIKYNLDALENKESYVRKYVRAQGERDGIEVGDLVAVQKSSHLVPGTTAWSQDQFYDMLFRHSAHASQLEAAPRRRRPSQ